MHSKSPINESSISFDEYTTMSELGIVGGGQDLIGIVIRFMEKYHKTQAPENVIYGEHHASAVIAPEISGIPCTLVMRQEQQNDGSLKLTAILTDTTKNYNVQSRNVFIKLPVEDVRTPIMQIGIQLEDMVDLMIRGHEYGKKSVNEAYRHDLMSEDDLKTMIGLGIVETDLNVDIVELAEGVAKGLNGKIEGYGLYDDYMVCNIEFEHKGVKLEFSFNLYLAQQLIEASVGKPGWTDSKDAEFDSWHYSSTKYPKVGHLLLYVQHQAEHYVKTRAQANESLTGNTEQFNNADPTELLTLIDLGMIESANAKISAYVALKVLEKYGKHIEEGISVFHGDVYFKAFVSDTHMMDLWQDNMNQRISCKVAYFKNESSPIRSTDSETLVIQRGEILSNDEAQKIADVIMQKLERIISQENIVNENHQHEVSIPFDDFAVMAEIGIHDGNYLNLINVGKLLIDNYGIVGAQIFFNDPLDLVKLEFRIKTKKRNDIEIALAMSDKDKAIRIVIKQLFRHHSNNTALKFERINYEDAEQSAIHIANIVLEMVNEVDAKA